VGGKYDELSKLQKSAITWWAMKAEKEAQRDGIFVRKNPAAYRESVKQRVLDGGRDDINFVVERFKEHVAREKASRSLAASTLG
jgi:hypothetical protein